MRKTALTIIFCMVSIICYAQNHLRFMDIPIEGTLEDFSSKLIQKGFTPATLEEGEVFVNMITLKSIGTFYGVPNCKVFTRKDKQLSDASSVLVETNEDISSSKPIKKFIEEYDNKYGRHEYEENILSESYEWNIPSGQICVISYKDIHMTNIIFTDYTEIAIKPSKEELEREAKEHSRQFKEEQTVKAICGIQFGTSYEKTKEILENKYGYPEYNPDKTIITYKNKSYAGFTFDSIHFLFQSDGIHSYLNGCVFIIDAESLSDAKKKQRMLYKKLSEKYIIFDGTDNNGNEFYYGGFPPISGDGAGFYIEILKYNEDLARLYNPYATRLMYGTYNYVKEEF